MMDKNIYVPVMAEQIVHISKEYGPLVACDVRVRLDFQSGAWIIEREKQVEYIQDGLDSLKTEWQEMARFDCQESLHFGDDEAKPGKR